MFSGLSIFDNSEDDVCKEKYIMIPYIRSIMMLYMENGKIKISEFILK